MRTRSAVIVFDCILYCLCLLGLWQIAEKADLPFAVGKGSQGEIVVKEVTAPANADGIRRGDLIVSLGGKMPVTLEGVEFILDGSRVGSELALEVRRSGIELENRVKLITYYSPLYVAVAFSVGTLFFLSGLIVFFRRQDDSAAMVYHFGALAVASIIMMTWGSFAGSLRLVGQVVRCCFSSAYAFVPVLFLHFGLVFPGKRRGLFPTVLLPLYSVAVILSILMSMTLVRATSPLSLYWFHWFVFFFDIARWLFVACVVAAVAVFASSYRTAREESERRKLRWVVLGLALSSLGFVSLWELPQLLTSKGLIREEFVVLLSGATPITFAVAIVKYHVLDIDYIFNRSTVYVIVLVILLSVYAAIVAAVAGIISEFTVVNSIFVSAGAAVVVALLFEPVRQRVQRFVDKTFFRLKYDMQEVEAGFVRALRDCMTAQDVAELLVDTSFGTIPAERAGFFVLDPESQRLRIISHRNFDLLATRSVKFEIEKLKTTLSIPLAVVDKVEPGTKCEPADKGVFERWGMTLVFTLKSEEGAFLGFFVMGAKKSGTRFAKEDIHLLNFLSEQSGYAYERIILQSRLILEHEERERVEELNRMKTYFVSSVSHDLKTPLTNIRMFTEILKSRRNLPASRARKYLEIVEGESDRLTRLIDNVLTVARSERGTIAYKMTSLSLNDVVKGTVKMSEYETRKAKCRVRLKLMLKHDSISADQDGIREALCNLISNAIQYSPGQKTVEVSTFARDGHSCISVKDRGIGIREEDLPHLFEPFYRGKRTSQFRPGGTGIGLSVVKNIMDAHGGQIEVRSAENKGTEITLLFPTKELK